MAKRDPRKTARNKADRLVQEINKLKHKVCLICPEPNFVGHHYIEKSNSNALRYEMKNIIPLCVNCHHQAHSFKPAEVNGKIVIKMGMKWLKNINGRIYEYTNANLGWYRANVERLEKIKDGLERNNSKKG